MVHACTHFNDDGGSVRRLRVIAGVARLYPELQRLSTQFSAATGIPVYFNFSTRIGSSGALVRAAMARPPPVVDSGDNTAGGADAFITTTSLLPNLEQGGKLLDVSGLVGEDGQLRWYEINSALREQMVVYGNKVVGIPVTTSPVFLFYHKPVFSRDNLTVPVTWDQVLALAERYNGTDLNGDGVPGYGMCMTPPDCFVDGTILQWILASFVQTQGSSQGLILDPDTLANMANSSAMAAALTVMKRLRRVGPLTGNCAVFEDEAYLEGRCLLSITTPTTFKAAYSPEKPARFAAMRGRMGMAPFPGSTRVLDRASGNLTDCDAARCPMARVKARDASGVKRPVNQPTPSANVVVMLNAQSPAKYQFYAYSLFSYLLSPNVLGSDDLMMDPRLETVPFRDTDITPDAAAAWVARGYAPEDVDQFLSTLRIALANPNQNFESKFPGNINISARMTAATVIYTNSTPGYVAPPLPVVLGMIGSAADAVVREQGGAAVFGPLYRHLLNWGRAHYSGDGSGRSTGDEEGGDASGSPGGGGGGGSGLSSEGRLVLAIALPCGVGLLAVAAAAVLWGWNRRREAARRRGRGTVVPAPGAGPDTTLLVTDIQSSTSLWEHLDAGVMDRALSTHHAVMRKAIADWHGYESATEGDSFIVCFSNATEALLCALAAQQALLDAAWPEELLRAGPGLVPGLDAPDVDPLAQVGAVQVMSSKQATRTGRLEYSHTLTQRAATVAGRSRNGSAWSWSLFGGPSHASNALAAAAQGLAGSGAVAVGLSLPGLPLGGTDDGVAAAAADSSPWRQSIGARRRAVSGSGHGASRIPHASETDEARTHDGEGTEDTAAHATARSGASAGEDGGYEEGTDGAGPSSSGWVGGPDSAGTSCFTPISLTAAAAASGAAPATALAAAPGSAGRAPGAQGDGRTAAQAPASAAAGVAAAGTAPVRGMQSPFELMAYGEGAQSGGTVYGRVSSRTTLTGPQAAVSAAVATAPMASVPHSTASGAAGGGGGTSGLLKAFSNITAAVGGTSSGLLWRLASAGATAGRAPQVAAGTTQGLAQPQISIPRGQPAGGGRVSESGPLVAQDALVSQSQHHHHHHHHHHHQVATPTAFRSSTSLSGNQVSQWWGHRVTNESGGGAFEQPMMHSYSSLAVVLSRCVRITRLQATELREPSSVLPSPSGARRVHTPTALTAVRTLTGGGHHSNDGSTPGAGATPAAAEGSASTVLFRGLRVRMGLHTGVAAAAEVTVNGASGRTQYSGDCITAAKRVSDTAHGGMVVFGEATRQRLDVDAVRAARPYLLYAGLHMVGRDGIGHAAKQRLHLYAAYGPGLLPRALVVRPLATAAELRPGVLAAPVGHGTVVQVRVVGAERLLSWNYDLASRAMKLLQDSAMQLLAGADDVSASRSTGGAAKGAGVWPPGAYVLAGGISLAATGQALGGAGGGGAAGGGAVKEAGVGAGAGTGGGSTTGVITLVFPDTDSAVSWAAALRVRLPMLEWPPELLEHELCEEVWAPAPSGAGFGDGYRFVSRQPLRHAMTANLPLASVAATGSGGGGGGGGAPAPRWSNNGGNNPLTRLSSAFRARLVGTPPSPIHGGARPHVGSAAAALGRGGGAGVAGFGGAGGTGAGLGSPHSAAFARTSDGAGVHAAGGHARSLPAGGSGPGADRRALQHCGEEEPPTEGEPHETQQQRQRRHPGAQMDTAWTSRHHHHQQQQQQLLPMGPSPKRGTGHPELEPDLAARVRAAIASSRVSREEAGGQQGGGGGCGSASATASIESAAPPAPVTPGPSSQSNAAAALMTSASSGSGPRRDDITAWRGAGGKQCVGVGLAPAGATLGVNRGGPAVAINAVASGAFDTAPVPTARGASLDDPPAHQPVHREPSAKAWTALQPLPPPSPEQPRWQAEAASAAAAALASVSAVAAARCTAAAAVTTDESPLLTPAGRAVPAVSSTQLLSANAAVKGAAATDGLPSEGQADVSAMSSSVEIEVQTSPVGWTSVQSRRGNAMHSGGPGTGGDCAGIGTSSNGGPGSGQPCHGVAARGTANPKLTAQVALAPGPLAGPSSQPGVCTPAASAKVPLSAAAATAPTTGPYSSSSRSVRAAMIEGAAAAAAMVANETQTGSLAAAAAAHGAGGAGEALAPLRLLYRGLRLRAAVSCGPLKGGLVAGDVSGHVSYRGKAFAQLGKLMAKAKTGQIVATADLARTLSPSLSEELTLIDKL
ncbi:hypothetical protein HYH02_001556 [Chlamydomonas schloesseri]|uniref:Guanylate cyclase domain-containing protein n=1 Tax=Chlamydomonas schloesseri TaxID=2026947 RepID=A0A835WTT8_9CHLO|nr:hypothetical protein HYH02_001556 [Chlamydomonas schloesseri]|eukprot:KAG2453332.1 hypothetical protein HYH02_001556 [Chlamydomonas schloesseri]